MKIRLILWVSACLLLLFPLQGICFDTGEIVLITAEKVATLSVRIAKTPEEWQQGLRGVDSLDENEGMFFLFPREGVFTFTARGVSFPIDIILINKTGAVVATLEDVSGNLNHASPFPIVAALEVNSGFCREHKVKAGNFVRPTGFRVIPKDPPRPRQEDREKVEAKLEENIKKHPDNPKAYEELAAFYTISAQHQKAVETFRKLLNMGISARWLNGMGVALANTGQREKAEQYFLRAIEKDPLFYRSYNNLIRINRRKGDSDYAVTLLRKAIHAHPEFVEARLGLARLYLAKGALDEAETLIQETPGKDKIAPEVERMSGDIHLRKGEYEKAADAYLKYLQARPYDPNASDLRVFVMVHKVKKTQEGR